MGGRSAYALPYISPHINLTQGDPVIQGATLLVHLCRPISLANGSSETVSNYEN